MIVKPLQVGGGMQAQLSAAAREAEGVTSWQSPSSAVQPLPQPLSALRLSSTLNLGKSCLFRAGTAQSSSRLEPTYFRDARVKAESAREMRYPECHFPFGNTFWPPPSLGGMTGKQLIFEIPATA